MLLNMTKAFISEILAMEAHGRVPEVTKKTENFQKNTPLKIFSDFNFTSNTQYF